MAHLLSYNTGIVGHGLSDDLSTAMVEAVERCAAVGCGASIVDKETYKVLAVVHWHRCTYRAVETTLS